MSAAPRQRLLARVDPRSTGAPVTWLLAPSGYGKSRLVRALAARALSDGAPDAVALSLADCESHASLFIAALARGLRLKRPDADLRALVGIDPDAGGPDWLATALAEVASRGLVLALDDVDRLDSDGPLARGLAAVIAQPPPGVFVVLAGRARPRPLPAGGVELARRDLALEPGEVRAHLEALAQDAGRSADDAELGALAEHLWRWADGWPVAVDAAARAVFAAGEATLERARALTARGGGVDDAVEQLLAPLRPESRYFAGVAAVVERFDARWAEAVFGGGGVARGGGRIAGSPEARRRIIRLSAEAVATAMAQLEAHQIVTRDGDSLAFTPVCRAALVRAFAARDPDGFREANRRAAELLIAAGEGATVALFDHLHAADEPERLASMLAPRVDELWGRGEHEGLERWLGGLAGHFAPPPLWVDYARARILGLRGRFDDARDHLERLRQHLDQGRGDEESWRWQPRLTFAYGELGWRRGALAEARTWAQRGVDFIDQARRRARIPEGAAAEVEALQVALETLSASIAVDVSSGERAREALREALGHARGPRHGVPRATLTVELAWNEVRLGDLGACRRIVADGLEAPDLRDERLGWARAQLVAADAVAVVGGGDLDGGLARALEARALLERSPDGGAAARVWGALGVVRAWRGERERAREARRAAVEHARAAGRAGLLGEALDRLALACLATGDADAASRHHGEAEALLARLLKLDGYLGAVHRETLGELRLAGEPLPRSGLVHLEAARDAYDRFGALHEVARLHWRLAELHHRLAEADSEGARADMLAQLEDACVIADERELRLPDEGSRRLLATIGARVGEDELARYCRGLLARLGFGEEDAAGDDDPAVDGYEAMRASASSVAGASYRVVSRDGVRWLDEEGYAAVADDGGPALVALVEEQTLVNFGKRVDLSQKRVMLPLLLTFLRAADEAFTMHELALTVWGPDEATGAAMQTKVKVAISRLRTLLGKGRKYIVTTRKDEGGESVAAYQLAPNLAFRIVERA